MHRIAAPRSSGASTIRGGVRRDQGERRTVAENQRKQQMQLDTVDIATQHNKFTNNPVGEDLPAKALDEFDELKRRDGSPQKATPSSDWST
jgi:hypothetical protein